MNNDKKEIVLKMLQESIDDVLRDDGFLRRQNTLLYIKKIGTTKQKIIMNFFPIIPRICKYILFILLVCRGLTKLQKK